MWPWGHAAFGYVLYSLSSRLTADPGVTGRDVLVLAVATQLPDLVDKSAAWVFDVFASGYAAGHSLFVALPVGLAVYWLAQRRDSESLGLAFVVGYWSHLAGDVLLAILLDKPYTVGKVLWPLVIFPGSEDPAGAITTVMGFLVAFLELLVTAEDPTVFVVFFGPPLAAIALWLVDGAPGLRELYQWAVRSE
ncbi:hypothetical protein BV210_17985 (plasmid) [Halorientalis sp. IM1011]|uniref:metal-dependent hydrolase n=1 Tax=Halorientalis sp. IM1011 TaxID=1932360 RepID=UPI00097CCF06|nr:metal-dependent hydrolase [Halorientalis sp. IM1011]AQL44656.1 hypothetical protein BV210_17985 [Halorientalis sp. IM1011]